MLEEMILSVLVIDHSANTGSLRTLMGFDGETEAQLVNTDP